MFVEGRIFQLVILLVVLFFILICLKIFKEGAKRPTLRKIPALDFIEEAVGRAVEVGRPINMTPGFNWYKVGPHVTQAMAAYSILGHVAEVAGRLGAELIVTIDQPFYITMAEEIVRNGYMISGNLEGYKSENIRWVSDQQMSFAAGVCGIMAREKVAANILVGVFFAESIILAETGSRLGAVQLGGTASNTQIPFFIATCNYVLIGEELYAAGSYLSGESSQIASIAASDYSKILVVGLIIMSIISSILNSDWLSKLFSL